MKIFILSIFSFLAVHVSAQEVLNMKTPATANKAFVDFIKKDKFGASKTPVYAGMADAKLRRELTEKVNVIAKGFQKVAGLEEPTDIKYNIEIMNGLSQFNGIKSQLSKSDRVRVCLYIIELMDVVELPSSKGQLNMFAYGFDPSTLQTKEK